MQELGTRAHCTMDTLVPIADYPFFFLNLIHLTQFFTLGSKLSISLIVWQNKTERFRAEKWVNINPRPHLAPSFLSIVLARRCRRLLELSQSFFSYPSLFISTLTCILMHYNVFLRCVCLSLTNQNTKH